MKAAIARLHTVPFEALFGWLAFIAGLIGLLHIGTSNDPLDVVLGSTLVTFFQACYTLAGLLMLLGVAKGEAWIEGPGIVLLVMSSVARLGAILILYGVDANVAVSIAFYILLVYYSCVRLHSLWRGDVLHRDIP